MGAVTFLRWKGKFVRITLFVVTSAILWNICALDENGVFGSLARSRAFPHGNRTRMYREVEQKAHLLPLPGYPDALSAHEFYDVTSRRWRRVQLLNKKSILFMHIVSEVQDSWYTDPSTNSLNGRIQNLYGAERNSSVLILTGLGIVEELIEHIGNFPVVLPAKAKETFAVREAKFGCMVRWFDERNGLEYFFQPVAPELPSVYSRTKVAPVPRCVGKTWSFEYAFWSGAVTMYHLLLLDLVERFNFVFKIDLDIRYSMPLPSLALKDAVMNCYMVHTSLRASTDCEDGTLDAMQRFIQEHSSLADAKFREAVLNMSSWEFPLFYGNFVGFHVNLLTDHRVLTLANFLYEKYSKGYFENRWTDQATMVMVASLFMNSSSPSTSNLTCDFSDWRTGFEHSHHFRSDPPFT